MQGLSTIDTHLKSDTHQKYIFLKDRENRLVEYEFLDLINLN